MKASATIYDFVTTQEAAFDQDIDINGWQWNFKRHVKTSFYYKHGRLLNGNDENTPVKNITRPILNLQYSAEDIEAKDIVVYVDDPDAYHLSFLIKKYYDDVFVVENDLDTFLDQANESKIDYGGGLVKKGQGARPEVIDLQSVAFCDQTDMLKGPIAFKHFFNAAELKDMEEVGWGDAKNGATTTIDDLIQLSETSRQNDRTEGVQNETPTSYIEVYEVHGVMPAAYLNDDADDTTFKRQFQIIAFYKTKSGERNGVTLFRKEQKVPQLKLALRDKVYSRALGFGGAEELFEPQVWTTYSVLQKKNMLDAASKVILKSIGAEMKSRYPNGLKDMDNLQIVELNAGEDLGQIDTTPRSIALFDRFEAELFSHAQDMGSAQDPLMGKESPSGTPFRAQERQVIEGRKPHERRRGQFAKFVESVYTDWIIPHIAAKITEGTRFLSELSTDELKYVVDRVVENEAKKFAMDKLFSAEVVTQQDVELFKQQTRASLLKGGNKKFIEILKGEFKKKRLRVKVNVAGKQKDLGLMADKITNIFRFIFANPQGFLATMQIQGMPEAFNDLLEYSGMSPVMFSGTVPQPQLPAPQQTSPQPTESPQLATSNV